MKFFDIFGHQFNGLEFVTYFILPTAIILVILVYILFNLRELKISMDKDIDILTRLEEDIKTKLDNLKEKEHENEKVSEKLLVKDNPLYKDINNSN